jgi:hypothetical protein
MEKGKLILNIFSMVFFVMILFYFLNLEQLKIIIFSLIITGILYFGLYYLFWHIIPNIWMKKRLVKQKPADALNTLINEFEESKRKKQAGRTVRLAFQIKNLYSYLKEDEKKRFKHKMKEVFSYTGEE